MCGQCELHSVSNEFAFVDLFSHMFDKSLIERNIRDISSLMLVLMGPQLASSLMGDKRRQTGTDEKQMDHFIDHSPSSDRTLERGPIKTERAANTRLG